MEKRQQQFRKVLSGSLTLIPFITKCETPRKLLLILRISTEQRTLNAIHCAAAFSKLSRFERRELTSEITNSAELQDLVSQAARLMERNQMGGRAIAEVLTAAATLRFEMPWVLPKLAPIAVRLVPDAVEELSDQGLSNLIWSLGIAHAPRGDETSVFDREDDAKALAALSNAAWARLKEFSNQDLSQVAWGLGCWNATKDQILKPLAEEAADRVPRMPPRSATMDLPQIAVSLVKLGYWHKRLMANVAHRLSMRQTIVGLNNWKVAALLWAWSHPASPHRDTAGDMVKAMELGKQASKMSFEQRDSKEWRISFFGASLRLEARSRGMKQREIDESPSGPKRSLEELAQMRPKPIEWD